MISALNTVVVPEEALVKRQLELEETYKIRGIERARKLITDALQNGGIMNLPMTQRMLTSAYEISRSDWSSDVCSSDLFSLTPVTIVYVYEYH